MCTVWKEEEELRLAKIRELNAWWRARGPTVSFIDLARQIVASSRGSGSWRISQENRKVERFRV
jgi:hypothetical protein